MLLDEGASVPSVYFIGKSGAPLDIIEKSSNPSEFQQIIEGVLKKAGVSINQTPSGSYLFIFYLKVFTLIFQNFSTIFRFYSARTTAECCGV